MFYLGAATAAGNDPNPRLLYLLLLFAICSTPALFLRKPNDRYSLYAIFFCIYFVSFGVIDALALAGSRGGNSVGAILTASESLILLGGAAFSLGYQFAARQRQTSEFAVQDWPMRTLMVVGLALWLAGTFATWYWNVRVTVRAGEYNNNTGQLVTTVLMLGRYAQPMGLLIVAYAYTIKRSAFLTSLIICMASYQVYLGFVSDTKGGAMLGGILVLVTGFLVKGKISKSWAAAGLAFIFLAFPIFQAHRTIVVGERGLSNANSADDIARALKLSIEGQARAEATEHSQSFFERSSVKSAVDMIVGKTGVSVPYQHGYTLLPLVNAFIPRLIWADKVDVQTGVLLNKEFNVTGDGVTYISPSHLGELYWNFGWPGALSGMLLMGTLFGWINRKCDLSVYTSVTRLLILGITITQLGVKFEASIATEYAVWLRSIVGVLIMHSMLRRGGIVRAQSGPSRLLREPVFGTTQIPFNNILR